MAYQVSHGLQLAANAVVKNFGVERVAADPTVTEAGRAWYNESSKKFKYSTLDGGGAVIIREFSSFEDFSAFVSLLASSAGAAEIGVSAFVSANSKIDVAAANLQTALQDFASDVDTRLVETDNAISSLDLQTIYDQTVPDGSGDAVIKLTTGKDLKVEDDTQTTVFFKVDSETGKVTITGDLEVTGETTTVESTVTSGDHWVISPDAGTTSGLVIEPDAAVVMTADLMKVSTTNGGAAVFRVTADGDVIADGRNIGTDGAVLDAHLDGGAGKHAGTEISYNNVTSGLTAVTVQAAIDELQDVIGGADGTSISDQIANLQTYVGAVDGTDTDPLYTSVNYITQGSSLTAAASALDGQVKANTTGIAANVSAIATVASDLSTEIDNRTNADTLQQAELDSVEAAVGLNADGTYTAPGGTNYLTGVATVQAGLVALDTQVGTNESAIGDLATLSTTVKTDLVSALNEAVSTASTGVDDLKTAINAQKFRYTSGTPAITHSITHSLNSIEISVSVWVYGDDLKWHNDLLPITIDDANSITIELSEARNIKVVIENEADLV